MNSDKTLLWYPNADIRTDEKNRMKTRGKYDKGYPEGAVIHFSAGASAESSHKWGLLNGYCFFTIAKCGKVIQSFPLDEWGYHAGISSYPTMGTSLSQKLVGIEMDSAGLLTKKPDNKYYTWFNKEVPKENVRFREAVDNCPTGFYEKCTESQEIALKALILWLKRNNPKVFNFDYLLSHSEISPGRKQDIGGSLSMDMNQYRGFIVRLYDQGDVLST